MADGDFRRTLLLMLDLPSLASDNEVLARVAKVVADSSALARVWWLADKAERKCNELDPSDVLAAMNPDPTPGVSRG
jgi:hypothetical protein